MAEVAPQALYIGIDLGTSGCRACVIDEHQRLVADDSRHFDAGLESDPQHWWACTLQVLGQVIAQTNSRLAPQNMQQIPHAVIAVDGTSGTLLLCNANGTPVTPALMYHDSRSQAQATLIKQLAPAESGGHGATSALAKLMYLQHTPGAASAAYALHQADWISAQLSGHYGVSDENNCLKLGYDIIHRCWPEWFDDLGINRSLLPSVLKPGAPIAPIRKTLASDFGLPASTQIVAGTTDGVASTLATGIQTTGQAVTSLGSTLILKILSDRPVFSPAHGVYSHRLDDQWLVGGASNCGGKTLLQFFSLEQLQQMTPLLQPNQNTGLNYYPLPAVGERFPLNDATLTPRLTPRPEDDRIFFQAILEGLAEVEYQGYQLLTSLGAPYPTGVYTVGGGSHNMAWQSIRENKLGIKVYTSQQTQAAFGTALLAARHAKH